MRNVLRWQPFFCVTVAATMAVLCVDAVAQDEATLAHRYNFENDNADDSVDGVNGILMAEPLFTDDAPAGNRSILLDGDQQYVDYPDPMDFGNRFSVAAWVKPDPAGVNIQTIVANAPGGWKTDGFKIFFNSWTADDSVSDGKVIIEQGDGADTGAAPTTDVDALVMDEWNQVVTTIDINGTDEAMMYINGVKVIDAGAVVVDMGTNLPWDIGAMPGGSWTWMGGIDDVQIYDGILTDEDAEWLFDNPGLALGEEPPTTLLGDVNLDDVVNGLDVDPFVDVLLNGPFQIEADMNQDGVVNGLDVDPFVAAVVGGGVAAVPEPSTLLLVLGAMACFGIWSGLRRRV